MLSVTMVTLSTGKTLLVVNGHTFRKDDSIKRRSKWLCTELEEHKCNVYLMVNKKYKITTLRNQHTHEPKFCKVFQERIL